MLQDQVNGQEGNLGRDQQLAPLQALWLAEGGEDGLETGIWSAPWRRCLVRELEQTALPGMQLLLPPSSPSWSHWLHVRKGWSALASDTALFAGPGPSSALCGSFWWGFPDWAPPHDAVLGETAVLRLLKGLGGYILLVFHCPAVKIHLLVLVAAAVSVPPPCLPGWAGIRQSQLGPVCIFWAVFSFLVRADNWELGVLAQPWGSSFGDASTIEVASSLAPVPKSSQWWGDSTDTPGLLRTSSAASTCAQKAATLFLATCPKGPWSSAVKHYFSLAVALPSQSRCSPCRPTAASACAVGEGWWPPFPAGSQGKDALPGRDRAARQPAARFGEERDRHGATCPERFITSSHSINATIRRWLGLEGHLWSYFTGEGKWIPV